MSSDPDEGPVYYREIQKNAYLKRIPNDVNTSKLRALGHKKPPLKAMWTLLCVHNGTTPFLEQYPGAECPSTRAHRPAWRACLRSARHVTASVQPRAGDQYDFLVDTDRGPVRMLAPDWDSMQEWVTTLRAKLHELRIVGPAQNVYGAPPAAPAPRAAARDPASPLPPPPPGPLDPSTPELRTVGPAQNVYGAPPAAPAPRAAARDPASPLPPPPPGPLDPVPGIELHTPISRPIVAPETPSNNDNQNSSPEVNDNTTTTTSSNHAQNSINSNQNSITQNSVTSNVNTTNTNCNRPTTSVSSQNSVNSFQNSITFPQNSLTSAQNSITFPQNSINSAQNSITFPQNSINTAQNPITFPQNSLNNGPSSINLPTEDIDISSWDPAFSSLPSTSQEKLEPKKSVAKICGQNICLDDSILKRNVTDSDEEFFAEIDRIHDSAENLNLGDGNFGKYKQRVVVTDGERVGLSRAESVEGKQRTNITVIQVSNRPPHTAIPVLGPETDVFDFNFKQKLKITDTQQNDFINIVNTETHLNTGNSYGTVFSPDSDYGHLSLTTTVNVKDVKVTDVNATDGVYERLCLASTSNNDRSPLSVRKVKMGEKQRKSSLPNLELADSTYEYLYPSVNTTVTVNSVREGDGSVNEGVTNSDRVSRSDSQRRNVRPVPPVESMVRGNVERSQSQNAYDGEPRRDVRRVQNDSPKRETKIEKPEPHPKPIWKRGLTELSLLSKLRGIAQPRRQSPPAVTADRVASSPVKVVRRSRPEVRVDSARRRSSSLSNGQSPPHHALQPLRARQAAALRAEQRRGACVAAAVSAADPPVLCEYERMVWVARWGPSGVRCGGRAGDRVAALAGARPAALQHARTALKTARTPLVDILFHRVPLGKIYVINRKDNESLGFKLDSECTIVSVEGGSPAARVGVPPPGKWCITEVNNRPINLVKGGEEEINRLSTHGTEVSILIQPAALVKKLRAAIKSSKPLLSIR
ncbi:uncharacterized protein [Epargyreus clarus]|uniref:uncharacterized protein n=1 Tax=Epargyreus clarus TaxID=520877 RepID=UPI003C2C957D